MDFGLSRLLIVTTLILTVSACAASVDEPVTTFEDQYFELSSGNTMHYYDVGNTNDKLILFVHGFPTSAFLYRKVIKRLCDSEDLAYRCIAVSHIGFGKSSCPGDASSISPLYLTRQLDLFIKEMNLQNFALVVHDWGGPIGTAAGMRNRENMTHLVLLNTLLSIPKEGLLAFLMDKTRGYFSKPRPILENIYPRLVGFLMQHYTTTSLSDEAKEAYQSPYRHEIGRCRTRAGLNLTSKALKDAALFEEIADNLKRDWQDKPADMIWGTDDPLLGTENKQGKISYEEIRALLPQTEPLLIPGASHFLQEDKPVEIAERINRFIKASPNQEYGE